MLNCARVVTAVVVCSSFCFVAQAETVWWDHEFDGTTTPSAGHVAMTHTSVPADDAIVNCPNCVGGKYFSMRGLHKWSYAMVQLNTPDPNTDGDNNPSTNSPAWDKAAGYWPRPADIGCPGNADASPFPHWAEAGWYVPGTGLGNPGCFAGGATIEIRYKWTCENGRGQCDAAVDDNSEGGLPLMYPPMQYQGLMRTDNARGDYIQFATWGTRPEIDIGDDWVVVRMVVGSSWEGMDYYIHDDGSLEPGTSNNRGADWQDASGNNQFGRDELARVVTFNNPYPSFAPEQNNRGWKGFETGGGNNFPNLFGGGNATFEVDYMRWAFDKKVAPVVIPEPATMALVGLGALLCFKRRRRH